MADQKQPEIVSLDDLLSGGSSSTDRTEVPPTPPPNIVPPAAAPGPTPPAGSAGAAPEKPAKSLNELEEIDALLNQHDPEFLSKMSELKAVIAPKEGEVLIPEVEKEPHAFISFFKRVVDLARYDGVGTAKKLGVFLKQLLIQSAKGTWIWIKELKTEFFALPGGKKLRILSLFVIPAIAFWIFKYTFSNHYLPTIDPLYVSSVADFADSIYEYDPQKDLEDFDTPLRQPEFMVLIDRFTVNLLGKGGARTGMGMFELYIEASTREGAIELKDREREVRDLLARTTELMSYQDLVTIEGKEKLKRAMRRRLNEELMTVGRVRTVYFQNLVLKP